MVTTASSHLARFPKYRLNETPTITKAMAHQRTAGVIERCLFQCCRCCPNNRDPSRAACSRGEERAKQAAASSRNGVVGKPGNTSPNPASVVNTSPVAIRSERRAACQAGVRGVWGRFPACRLSDAFRSCCEGTAGLSATVYPGNRPPSVRPGLPLWAINLSDFRDVGSVDKATSPVRVAGVKVGDLSVLP